MPSTRLIAVFATACINLNDAPAIAIPTAAYICELSNNEKSSIRNLINITHILLDSWTVAVAVNRVTAGGERSPREQAVGTLKRENPFVRELFVRIVAMSNGFL